MHVYIILVIFSETWNMKKLYTTYMSLVKMQT